MKWILLVLLCLCAGCCSPGRVMAVRYYPTPTVRVDVAVTVDGNVNRFR